VIIVSQDKLQIFNFKTAKNIWIEDEEVEINQIEQIVYSIYIDGEMLGAYETEERAKEVLQEIINTYLDCNEENIYEKFAYVKNKVYEMPKE
jgi:hypothetical protein